MYNETRRHVETWTEMAAETEPHSGKKKRARKSEIAATDSVFASQRAARANKIHRVEETRRQHTWTRLFRSQWGVVCGQNNSLTATRSTRGTRKTDTTKTIDETARSSSNRKKMAEKRYKFANSLGNSSIYSNALDPRPRLPMTISCYAKSDLSTRPGWRFTITLISGVFENISW